MKSTQESLAIALTLAVLGCGKGAAAQDGARAGDGVPDEVSGMFDVFRRAEDGFREEFAEYGSAGSESEMWPSKLHGHSGVRVAELPESWRRLGVRYIRDRVAEVLGRDAADRLLVPSDDPLPIVCQYAAIAGRARSTDGMGVLGLEAFDGRAPEQDWYYLVARCDLDDDPAVQSTYVQTMDSSAIRTRNPGR